MTTKEYNQCVELYADRVFRFIIKNIRHQSDAEDIVQDAFEKLWRNYRKVDFKKARAYLFTTAYHEMINTIRKVGRMSWVEQVPERIHRAEAQDFEIRELLSKGLEQLSEVQRSVVLLRDYEGYSYKEIAKITELNESQVKVYIFRARKKLQSYLVSMDKAI